MWSFNRRPRRPVPVPRRFNESPQPEENPYFHHKRVGEERVVSSRLFVAAGLVVIILGLVYLLSFDRSFELSLTIQGVHRADPAFIESTAQEILATRTWGMLKRNKYTTLSPSYMERELLQRVGKTIALDSVHVEKQFPDGLTITITEREPELLWTTNGRTYLLDAEGVIVQEVTLDDPENPDAALAEKPRIQDLNNFPVEIGQAAIIPETPQSVLIAHAKFTALGFVVSSYNIPVVSCEILLQPEEPEASAEEALIDETNTNANTNRNTNANSNQNVNMAPEVAPCDPRELAKNTRTIFAATDKFEIRFSNSTLEPQLAKLERLVQENFFGGKNLTYIDIRFGERVYYR